MAVKNIIGERFGRLVVLEKTTNKDNGGHLYYKCKCDCGKECEVTRGPLLTGRTKSCGCLKKELLTEKRRAKLEGQRFGHLLVLEVDHIDSSGKIFWKCQCDCENKTIISVPTSNLTKGNSTSCGCDRKSKGEKLITQILKENNISFISQWDNNGLFRYLDTNYPIKFDFYLTDYNCIIEYDGIQHFTGWNGDKNNLNYVKNHDLYKEKICQENNIKIIHIPYSDFNQINIDYLKKRII